MDVFGDDEKNVDFMNLSKSYILFTNFIETLWNVLFYTKPLTLILATIKEIISLLHLTINHWLNLLIIPM